MTERRLGLHRAVAIRRGRVQPLSPQAWQRVEAALFARLEAAPPCSRAPALARSATGEHIIDAGRLRLHRGIEPR